MTDAAYTFNQTVSERTVQKRSALCKKNGPRTQKLGNKPLTNDEIDEKHGPVMTYDLNRFLSFNEFREMPIDIQIEYLNKLQDKYDIGLKHIDEYLFNHRDPNILRSHCKLKGYLNQVGIMKKRGKTGLNQFRFDIAESKRNMILEPVIDFQEAKAKVTDKPTFATWDEFKAMLDEDKVIFINRILAEYKGLGLTTIDEHLFHKTPGVLKNLFNRRNIADKIENRRHVGGNTKTLSDVRNQFLNDVDAWRAKKSEAKDDEDKKILKKEEPVQMAIEEIPDIPGIYNTPVEENTKPEEIEQVVAEPDPMLYHDASFSTSYIRDGGLDENELEALVKLFRDRRVRVKIDITVL